MPSTPPAPEYVSSTDSQIVIKLKGSERNGGALINNYKLYVGTTTLTLSSAYTYSSDGLGDFTYLKTPNSLTTGTVYRFAFKAFNS